MCTVDWQEASLEHRSVGLVEANFAVWQCCKYPVSIALPNKQPGDVATTRFTLLSAAHCTTHCLTPCTTWYITSYTTLTKTPSIAPSASACITPPISSIHRCTQPLPRTCAEVTAKDHVDRIVKVSTELTDRVFALYPIEMPASTNWLIST